MGGTFMRPSGQTKEDSLGSSLPELLEQVRLLDTEAFQLKEELVSQLQEAYAAKDSKRLSRRKLLEAVREIKIGQIVTSVDYLKYFYQA